MAINGECIAHTLILSLIACPTLILMCERTGGGEIEYKIKLEKWKSFKNDEKNKFEICK